MIRISLSQRPEAWHDVNVYFNNELGTMRVRYWLLLTREAAALERRRLRLLKASNGDPGQRAELAELLLEHLSEEFLAEGTALLQSRVLDWDLVEDEHGEHPGQPVPFTAANLDLLLAQKVFWLALWNGLVDASSGLAARKNA